MLSEKEVILRMWHGNEGRLYENFDSVLGLERSLMPILEKAEEEAFLLDYSKLKRILKEKEIERDLSRENVQKILNLPDLNVESTKKVALALDSLGLDLPRTKKGGISCNSTFLKSCRHPVARELSVYRKSSAILKSIKSISPFLEESKYGKDFKKLKFNFSQIGPSGNSRIYSSDTSATQIPKEVRMCIIPPKGYYFLKFDYKQAELRLAAFLSQDNILLDILESGKDIHEATYELMTGNPCYSKDCRNVGKTLNFAYLYRSEGYSISRELDISMLDAVSLIKQYTQKFSGLERFARDQVEFLKQNGFVDTIIGRRRFLADPNSSEDQRRSVNTPCQSGVGDLLKISIVRIFREYPELIFLMSVFDSALYLVPVNFSFNEVVSKLIPIVEIKLEGRRSISMKAAFEQGDNWGDII